jgi:hypothetical protein
MRPAFSATASLVVLSAAFALCSTPARAQSTIYFDDFSGYPAGQAPAGWLQRGASDMITATVEDIGGGGPAHQALYFPEVPFQYWDKWTLKDGVVLSGSYTVTVKMNFQASVADRAGLTIAWDDATWDRIDIQPNVYGQDIEFRISSGSAFTTANTTITNAGYIPINAFMDNHQRDRNDGAQRPGGNEHRRTASASHLLRRLHRRRQQHQGHHGARHHL